MRKKKAKYTPQDEREFIFMACSMLLRVGCYATLKTIKTSRGLKASLFLVHGVYYVDREVSLLHQALKDTDCHRFYHFVPAVTESCPKSRITWRNVYRYSSSQPRSTQFFSTPISLVRTSDVSPSNLQLTQNSDKYNL